MTDNSVTIQLSPFWATIISAVLIALCLSIIYGTISMRDAVRENARNGQDALVLIKASREARNKLRDRMNSVETRIAIWEDRMRRRNPDRPDSALWRPQIDGAPLLQSLVYFEALGGDRPSPAPRAPPVLNPPPPVLPKLLLVTYGSA